MEKKVIIKELHKPVREVEIDVKDGLFMEDVMSPMMERPGDVVYVSLNRLNTMYLVVNGMSGIELEDNFLYVENDGVMKDGLLPQVKPARGTAYFVRVEWVQDGYKKKPKIRNITEDDFIYARNFMTDLYQRKLKETNYPMLFS